MNLTDPFCDADGDKLREECGIFGMIGGRDAAAVTADNVAMAAAQADLDAAYARWEELEGG